MQRLQDYVTFDRNGQRLLTLTFGLPEAFYRALAHDLKRPGDLASDPEVEEYLREVVRANIEHTIQENMPKKIHSFRVRRTTRHNGTP